MGSNSENKLLNISTDYSFKHAYESLPKNKMKMVREEIRKILGVTTDKSVYDRISGRIELKMSEHQAIVPLFKKNGIEMQFGKNE